mmetsp:Transcript_27324/g.45500  ORF Transcript_27324/g.45500 Transcript_27324/m.45500 type:complete len:179 (+) Transcript_27324:109-645(+)|eukprot:CAMPEP_0119012802 /NCGR_PEP_ID=MMETSP1176-20130426/7635_1 /TAXON_ID=265551 /ORGANISM="Synedropsis recta cf, Strain CCMP1620" /LENGTH=178 /DNA_ID=CAMNT_0006965831 /DNA_START=70 /DNA_END=606 /DNA_ORIENTATION=+
MPNKISWQVFFDLQCPFSRVCWKNLPMIRERFDDKYEITVTCTSLAFHPQAFSAQCAANLIEGTAGKEARVRFHDKAFEKQELYMNAAIGDARKSEIDAVFANLAEEAGCFRDQLSKEHFLANINNWETAVKPAWAEHKVAMGYGVFGTPKHVINEKLVEDTESAWGPDEWEVKLASL